MPIDTQTLLKKSIAKGIQSPGNVVAGAIQVVPVSRLDYVEAADDAIRIATAGVKLRKQQPIGELAAQLDPDRFVRIHRAYVVNIERIEKIELYAKDSRVAILRDGTRLPVSRSGYQRLKELL